MRRSSPLLSTRPIIQDQFSGMYPSAVILPRRATFLSGDTCRVCSGDKATSDAGVLPSGEPDEALGRYAPLPMRSSSSTCTTVITLSDATPLLRGEQQWLFHLS
jgi:hypothetical protein